MSSHFNVITPLVFINLSVVCLFKVQCSTVAYTLQLSPSLQHQISLFCLFLSLPTPTPTIVVFRCGGSGVSLCKHVVQLLSELGIPHSERVALPFLFRVF